MIYCGHCLELIFRCAMMFFICSDKNRHKDMNNTRVLTVVFHNLGYFWPVLTEIYCRINGVLLTPGITVGWRKTHLCFSVFVSWLKNMEVRVLLSRGYMWEDALTANVDPSSPESQLHDQKMNWPLTFHTEKKATVEAYISYHDLASVLVFGNSYSWW